MRRLVPLRVHVRALVLDAAACRHSIPRSALHPSFCCMREEPLALQCVVRSLALRSARHSAVGTPADWRRWRRWRWRRRRQPRAPPAPPLLGRGEVHPRRRLLARAGWIRLRAPGESVIKCISPLNVVKYAYDHSCCLARSYEYNHLMTDLPGAIGARAPARGVLLESNSVCDIRRGKILVNCPLCHKVAV
jgi:hypothetical protein